MLIIFLVAVLSTTFASVLVAAGAVTQGFKAKTALPNGSVVSLSEKSSDTVEKTTLNNEKSLVGVAATEQDALVDLQPAGSEIRVAVSGDTSLLVTDLNGDIKPGDQLVVSPLSGITMKFSDDLTNIKIVATAGEAFGKNSAQVKQIEVEQSDGTKKTVYVGRISAQLLLSERSQESKQNKNILETVGEKLTGKPTNPVRLIASTIVAVSTFALAGLILNGSVKGSFISLGRNPLSKDSIVSGLFRAALLAIVIVAMGLTFAYLILLL